MHIFCRTDLMTHSTGAISVNFLTPILNFYQTKVGGLRVIFPGEHDFAIKRALATVVFEYLPKYRFFAYFSKKSQIRSGQPDQ